MLFSESLAAQGEQPFQVVLESYLNRAPMQVDFHYSFTQGDFQHDTSGVLILLGANVFRLELWDKVYGSDGSSLYLHDRNTHQTVIDSLRWSDLSLWLRLLNGRLPAGTDVVAVPGQAGDSRWELRHLEPRWVAEIAVDTASGSIIEITLRELAERRHRVRLSQPEPWSADRPLAVMTLQDLPGVRLDLR